MKRDIISFFAIVFMSLAVYAQNDTMYIMKDGIVLHKQCITPENVDSIIFYQPDVQFGSVTDIDGNVYPTLQLGEHLSGISLIIIPVLIVVGI